MKIAIRAEGSTDIGELAYDGSLQKGPLLILLEKLACFQNYLSVCGFTDNMDQKDLIEWVYVIISIVTTDIYRHLRSSS